MQHRALYNKYRPQRFDEVIGQDHVTATLTREIIEDKVAHAYLFTGPRGTGKTTSARLLAKALNCVNREPNGEPCNTCNSCMAITDGTSLDVIELDAASHNKVEDIREIRMNVSTVAAAPGARRVYILDEAHMLSRAASNALLKTLEEPPEHVVFALATTEPYKLLDTIRSRTQRFDFQPIATETLIEFLATVANREGFTHDRAALGAVTSHAGGSVRDALSLLEQVAALGAGTVSSAGVGRALGLADRKNHGRLLDAMHRNDAPGALTLIAELAAHGTDLRRFVADTIGYLRGVFLAQYTNNVEEVADETDEVIDQWKQQATTLSSVEVLRAIDELSRALLHLRDGREERLVVELAVLKLTRPETTQDIESLTVRFERLEREVRELKRTTPTPQPDASTPHQDGPLNPDRPFAASDPPPTPRPSTSTTSEAPTKPIPDAAPTTPDEMPTKPQPVVAAPTADITIEAFERVWPAIVATIRQDVGPRRHALLREAAPVSIEGGTVVFEVASHMHFHLEQLKSDEGITNAIATAGSEQLGQPINVVFRSADAPQLSQEEDAGRAPDKDDLLDAGDDAVDPASVVLDILGGEIVSDTDDSGH